MNSSIDFKTHKAAWIAVGLMALQLFVKFALEIGKAAEANEPGILVVAIAFTIGWIVIIPLCISGRRIGYWAGAVWGLAHFIFTPAVPIMGMCNHNDFATFVALHGLAIAAANIVVLLLDAKKSGQSPYLPTGKTERFLLLLGFVATSLRTAWITFFEPRGAVLTQTAWAGTGGATGLATSLLFYILIVGMLTLCFIIPGIIMKKRWAFLTSAVFGLIFVVLTVAIVVMRWSHPMQVNQTGYTQVGPYLVIAASLGMLVSGIGMVIKQRNIS